MLFRLTVVAASVSLLGACTVLAPQAEPPAASPVQPPFGATASVPSATAAAPPAVAPSPGSLNATGDPTAGPRPAPPATPPGSPPPFATVVKDAKRIDGVLPLWQKDEKVWIELTPQMLGQPFLLSPKLRTGLGEAWIVGGLMAYPVGGAGGPQVVEFVRVHNQVRLQSRNLAVTAPAGSPEARALEASYSNSLLGSTAVASQPQPDTKAILIEANALFLSDMLGVGMMLQRAYRQGYALDGRNSTITAVRSGPNGAVIETLNHYYTASVAVPQPGQPGPSPTIPRYLPDARSLLVGHHYSLAPLPAVPMPARKADARVGLFTTSVLDWGNETARTPRTRYVNRWRLEKQDPAAALSDPVKPITFWIDRNVPLAYRDTVRDAVLEWNKAFEKIGIRNAIAVQQQPDDANFDTLDAGVASVRWMMSAEPTFAAIGPTHVDPRTGEILDADIGVEGIVTRARRAERTQLLAGVASGAGDDAPLSFATPYAPPPGVPAHAFCAHGEAAAEQAAYALDVLAARDEIAPDGPEAKQFVLDYLRETVMHEVGHALGLRHNFRASRVYSEAQLADPEFTREHGTAGSVMEYNAVNLARPGTKTGTLFQTTLGPYDYWAVEYAYKPLPAAGEAEALRQIAARGSDPLLAYGSDEDNAIGLDPETVQLDLGSDPIAFAGKRLAIARDLFHRQETRQLPPEEDYAVLRRSLGYALADVQRAVGLLARQIGGVRTLRDFPGSGRDPLQPVETAVQRQALDQIVQTVFAADGLSISPALQRRLAPDYQERSEFGAATDFALSQRLLGLQRSVLGYLMSDELASRVLASAEKLDRGQEGFSLAELYGRLGRELWSDLTQPGASSVARRELQREHVNRIAAALVRPQQRADARALLREQARELLARLDAATTGRKAPRRDAETRAHLLDSADTLRQALAARLPRVGL